MKIFKIFVLAAMSVSVPHISAEEVNGIILSTADNPVYYKISNMRAARMNYVDYENSGLTAGDIVDVEGELIGHDNAGGTNAWLPEYLPNGEETPNIMDFPYMGLAMVENKFWTAFSAMEECMDPRTIYWWFEKAKTVKNGVYIHNAVIDGALKKSAERVNGKYSMSFSEIGKGIYYLIPLTQGQMDKIGFEDEEFSTDAFAISNANKVADDNDEVVNPGSCLDMNNYVTYNYEVNSPDETEIVQEVDADGNPVFDENGEPVEVERPVRLKYGFVGVNRAWNPLNLGSNDNVRINNGSLFKVSKIENVAEVEEAIESFKSEVANIYRAQASDLLDYLRKETVNRVSVFKNVPELYSAEYIDRIIEAINQYEADFSNIINQYQVDVFEADVTKQMEEYYNRALSLAGDGTVITLQQMLAIRDWPEAADDEDFEQGNAYLSSDGVGYVNYQGSMDEVDYPALTCKLKADTSCSWTLEWVPYQGYRLKNGDKYIRQFGNWDGMESMFMDALGVRPSNLDDGESIFDYINPNQMSWALTTNPKLAAVFTFSANDTAIQDVTLNETMQEYVDVYGEAMGYDITDENADNYLKNTRNIIHLQSMDLEGNTTYLCRDSAEQNYIVDSWDAGNLYFAAPNCWKVQVISESGELPLPLPLPEEMINGIYVSTAENPVYYTISNMRAARMNFVDHQDGELFAGDIVNGEGEVVWHDSAGGSNLWLPEFLSDGEETPNIMNFPYMGLAKVDNKVCPGFSNMDQCMDKNTIYWWFEKAKTVKNGVYIHNAVIDGTIKKSAEHINGRPNMTFSETAKGIYYVLPLTQEQLDNVGFEDREFSINAFAISSSNKVADENNEAINPYSCLDMNNYVTYNYEVDSPDETEEVHQVDADGNPVFDADGEPVMVEVPVKLKYGFVGVNRTWNPLNPGSNDNVRINNGSLFKVSLVTDVDKVNEAIDNYNKVIREELRENALAFLEQEKEKTINQIYALKNVPELYNGHILDRLEVITNYVYNFKADVSNIINQEDLDLFKSEIEREMEVQYLLALALNGDGTKIQLQQMLAIRDWANVEYADQEDNVGNAYLSADGIGHIKYDGCLEEIGYPALTCRLTPDETCEWTMEWASNGYRLKNGENYIRQFGNWTGMQDMMMKALGFTEADFDEDEDLWNHIDSNVMTWALTKNPALAAVFTFSANDKAIQDMSLSENEKEIIEVYGEYVGYNIDDEDAENFLRNTTNIIHLTSKDPQGVTRWLCRDSAPWNYIVDSWNAGNRYFANPNCWKVKKTFSGEDIADGISEIREMNHKSGIYDLQGRKISKPGKGLYIINGVKTLIK